MWLCLWCVSGQGLYDRHLLAGWTALGGSSRRRPGGIRRRAYGFAAGRRLSGRRPGLDRFPPAGVWPIARTLPAGRCLWPTLADAYDGLAWSQFKLGQREAAAATFRLRRATILAWRPPGTDWAGVPSLPANPPKPLRCFQTALVWAPWFADAYRGLAASVAATGHSRAASLANHLATLSERCVARSYQLTSTPQIACWRCSYWESSITRATSFAVVVGGLILLAVGAHWLPGLAASMCDIGFIYNLLALLVALGGQYLRLTRFTWLWLVASGGRDAAVLARGLACDA